MAKTAYYSDQDFEHYMARSKRERKISFYVWLACLFIIQPVIWYIILAGKNVSVVVQIFLIVISILALLCLLGLWFCYYSTKQAIRSYHKMREEQQAEANALLDEVEEIRQTKLNAHL